MDLKLLLEVGQENKKERKDVKSITGKNSNSGK